MTEQKNYRERYRNTYILDEPETVRPRRHYFHIKLGDVENFKSFSLFINPDCLLTSSFLCTDIFNMTLISNIWIYDIIIQRRDSM
jgi:hypothetical protein